MILPGYVLYRVHIVHTGAYLYADMSVYDWSGTPGQVPEGIIEGYAPLLSVASHNPFKG